MRSDADVPVDIGERGEGGAWPCTEFVGDSKEPEFANVVERCMFVVSAEGGSGRFWYRSMGERTEDLQRKHSPVPK